jgi:hypothetical protein
VLFVGWRPYVLNLRDHGTIIYPPRQELGYYSQAQLGGQIPPNLAEAGHGLKVAALFFGRTNVGDDVAFKIPGTLIAQELKMTPDGRNGGFGPFFGAETILALLALAWAAGRISLRRQLLPASIALTCLATTLLFPEPWWARFVPLAWVLPLAMALWAKTARPGAASRILMAGVLSLAAANMAIAGYSALADLWLDKRDFAQKLDAMAREPQPVYLSQGTVWKGMRLAADEVWRERLRLRGKSDVVLLPRTNCVAMQFLSADISRCRPPADL